MGILRAHNDALASSRTFADDPAPASPDGHTRANQLKSRYSIPFQSEKLTRPTEPAPAATTPREPRDPSPAPAAAQQQVIPLATALATFDSSEYALPPTRVNTSLIQGEQVIVEGTDRITVKRTELPLPTGRKDEYIVGRPRKALNLWEEGQLTDQHVYVKGAPWPPNADQLVAAPQKYTETSYVYLVNARDGLVYTYCPGGFYGPAAIDDLIDRVALKWRDCPGAWPICLLSGRRIPTREYGVKWIMAFEIVGWSLTDGTRAPV
jgi:hypothetical protein